jgi:hypothetical protein
MAWNGHGQRVGSASPSNCAGRLGCAHVLGNIAVAHGGACRDFLQHLPDTLLERGATDIEWEIEANAR